MIFGKNEIYRIEIWIIKLKNKQIFSLSRNIYY